MTQSISHEPPRPQDFNIVFFEVFDEERRLLEQEVDPSWDVSYVSETIQESPWADTLPPAPVVCIRTQSVVPPSWDAHLKACLARSTGYDHLASLMRRAPHVAVGCLPEYCSQAVAEHAVLLLWALLRKLPRAIKQARTFERHGLTGRQWQGLKVLVAGVGRIGSRVVDVVRALGADCRGVDLVERRQDLPYTTLAEGLVWADACVVCMDLNDRSRGLFTKPVYEAWGRNRYLVNVGRGEITPFEDLAWALEQGFLAGVGLDVYENEAEWARCVRACGPQGLPAAYRSWFDDERVILTPHNAFNTQEALIQKVRLTVEALRCYLASGRFEEPRPA
ncbi:MAG: lactate dehydrogenase [Phycisphaerae bacterium]|nr:MAG: lactate dehydrogenase [Phycisphaerae bacterium]